MTTSAHCSHLFFHRHWLPSQQNSSTAHRPQNRVRALLMPHAGFTYSATQAALAISRDRFNRVLWLGPDHRVGKGAYATPNR
ncbi:AmmeMemoRadiSam system protein B [Desulfosarcina sp.]|uniref:AmmeMemoRadiSam system protein B n=1 Tax=Desulfosarcina sp. TaxID=2027861 RepID=UPI003561C848